MCVDGWRCWFPRLRGETWGTRVWVQVKMARRWEGCFREQPSLFAVKG
jgi:hypothetical protein